MSAPASPGGRLALRGPVEGVSRTYLLAPGPNRVGSAAGNEVVLPVRGVSRHHARLVVGEAGATVEDLASKNGTFVNDLPRARGRVVLGDLVRFGPVELRLDALGGADGELAIALPAVPPPPTPARETARLAPEEADGEAPAHAGLVLPDGYVPGDTPPMRALHRLLRAVAGSDLPVLVLGETGVGKEWVARILHLSSLRRGGPFVAINCAAIPAELLEAELFGIAKGAATGVAGREGRFQLAAGGTLFLDEVGDMPPGLQSKLLRALEEREVLQVGGPPVRMDARVVAATNVDLERRLADGSLRRDLYYRLAGCVVRVPALAERREDVPALVEHFLRVAAREIGATVRGMTAGALARLVERPWPGNVRELEHEVRRLVCLCSGSETIVAAAVGPGATEVVAAPGPRERGEPGLDLAAAERRLIEEALARASGNRSRAARLLGISREALRRRLARHRLAPHDR